jgi:ubiquinol-cytochrome c reductase cytochrome b subunit
VPWSDVGLEGPFRPAEATNTLHPAWSLFFLSGGLRIVPAIDLVLGPIRLTNMFVAGVIIPGLLFGALVAYPFFERWWLRDDVEHHVLASPLDLPMRAGVTAVLTGVLLVLTLAAAVDVISFWLRAPVEGVIWGFRIALVVVPAAAAAVAVGLARRRVRGSER